MPEIWTDSVTKFEDVMSDAHVVPEVISGKGPTTDLDQGAAHDLSVRELQERLAELERSEKEQSAETAQEFEFCARLTALLRTRTSARHFESPSTTALLALLPTRLCSMKYWRPPSKNRTRPASLKIAFAAGSWSDFTSKSPCRTPTSFMNETSFLDVNDRTFRSPNRGHRHPRTPL